VETLGPKHRFRPRQAGFNPRIREVGVTKKGPAGSDPPALTLHAKESCVLRFHGLAAAALWMQKNRTSLRPVCGATPQFFSMASLTNLAETPPKLTVVLWV